MLIFYRLCVILLLGSCCAGIWANYSEQRKVRLTVESLRGEVPMSGLGN